LSFGTTSARHRAKQASTTSLLEISKAVSSNAGSMGRQAAVIAAASGLVLTSGIAANAAETSVQRDSSAATTLEVKAAPQAVAASSTAKLSFVRTAVKTEPAPVVEAPVVEAQSNTETQTAPVADNTANTNTQVTGSNVAAATPAPKTINTASASGKGAAIAAAALAQLGVNQDCTALVSNSLRAVGINFHDWPAGYLSLGRTVSAAEAQPGDVIYYADGGVGVPHVAVYIGNGQAVHGGFLGYTTKVYDAFVGSGPVFIRVGG